MKKLEGREKVQVHIIANKVNEIIEELEKINSPEEITKEAEEIKQ